MRQFQFLSDLHWNRCWQSFIYIYYMYYMFGYRINHIMLFLIHEIIKSKVPIYSISSCSLLFRYFFIFNLKIYSRFFRKHVWGDPHKIYLASFMDPKYPRKVSKPTCLSLFKEQYETCAWPQSILFPLTLSLRLDLSCNFLMSGCVSIKTSISTILISMGACTLAKQMSAPRL